MSAWIDQLFDADIMLRNGGVARRKKTSVARYASVGELEAECRLRGATLIETTDQYVVIMQPSWIVFRPQ